MALNIKDPETDNLARELADLTGASITDAVKTSLRTSIIQARRRQGKASLDELLAIAQRCAARPVLDDRDPDDMLYDDYGIPK